MKVISKELANALKVLQENCQNHPDCGAVGNCPFYLNTMTDGTRCYFKSRTPNNYNIKEKTQTVYTLGK